MSKLKIRLFGLAFILASLFSLGTVARPANACIDMVVWAINPATGECREFGTPCQVPKGWTVYYYDVCSTS